MVREGLGVLIRLGGVLVVTRLIGPRDYGLYVTAAAVAAVFTAVAQLGVGVNLIRQSAPLDAHAYNRAFSFLLLTSGVVVLVGLGGTFLAQPYVGETQVLDPLRVLLVVIPTTALWVPAQARFERAFRYRAIAYLELGGDLALYGTAVPVALAGLGVWAPVLGYAAWQVFLAIGGCAAARTLPRWEWSGSDAVSHLRFGSTYLMSTLTESAANLVNPIVVGRFLGPTGVGWVGLAIRLVSTLSFVVRASWRLSLVAIARVQQDQRRLRRGLEEGMALQLLVLGPVLAAFAIVAPAAVRLLFGRSWAPVAAVFPYLGLAGLVASVFHIPTMLLYSRGANAVVTTKRLVGLGLTAGLAVALVPGLGVVGFGLASIAGLASVVIIHRSAQSIVRFGYGRSLPWLVAFGPPLFFSLAPWPERLLLLAPVPLVLVSRAARAQIAEYTRLALRATSTSTASTLLDPDPDRGPGREDREEDLVRAEKAGHEPPVEGLGPQLPDA